MKFNKGNGTKCWGCKHAVPNRSKGNGCSWSMRFEPVDGWTAERDTIASGTGKSSKLIETYRVIECPKFEEG